MTRKSNMVRMWAEGKDYTEIVCRAGHNRRVIDRLRVDDHGDADLYFGDPPPGEQLPPGMSDRSNVRHGFGDDEHGEVALAYQNYQLRCPTCGLDVRLRQETLDRLALGLRDLGAREVELRQVVASISKQ